MLLVVGEDGVLAEGLAEIGIAGEDVELVVGEDVLAVGSGEI